MIRVLFLANCLSFACLSIVITSFVSGTNAGPGAPSVFVSDPLKIPVISERVHDDAFAGSDGVHIDPGFCANWPRACEWVKWHERCHYLYFHGASRKCDGSLDGENNADAYAVDNASADQTREAIRWFRSAIGNGRREIGNHLPIHDRANRIEALLKTKLQTEPDRTPARAVKDNGCTEENYRGIPRGATLLQCGTVTARVKPTRNGRR